MRTRSQPKVWQTVGEQEASEGLHETQSIDDDETLSNVSRDAVGKLLKRVKKGFNKEDVSYLRHYESAVKMEKGSKDIEKKSTGTAAGEDTSVPDSYSSEAMLYASNPERDEDDNDYDDFLWENGSIPRLSSTKDLQEDLVNGVSVEFDISHGLEKRKPVRRVTAEEKEVAEFVHKVHLLCLLGRGRLIDSACNDPLIQASLLSLVPAHLLKIIETPKLTASSLSPLVSWFHNNFHVRSPNVAGKSCQLALASTLETQEGTPEEVAALSVALFRALNLTTRFVSILDVVSMKPVGDKSESTIDGLFSSSTLMVAGASCSSSCTMNSSPDIAKGGGRNKAGQSRKQELQPQESLTTDKLKDEMPDMLVSEAPTNMSEPCLLKSAGLKRKGDLEFQMQLEMALAATAVGSSKTSMASNASESPSPSTLTPPKKNLNKIRKGESQTSSSGISTAIGSKKMGAPLYWAEVFCNGENLTGKWVHVDAVNAIIDGEHKVEAAAAACKKSLRYVVAFAGSGAKDVTRSGESLTGKWEHVDAVNAIIDGEHKVEAAAAACKKNLRYVVAFAGSGAKDVTRRYCTKWYKIAAQRISSAWWDAVLAPLKNLESRATGGIVNLDPEASGHEYEVANLNNINNSPVANIESCMAKSFASTRSSLEDMELQTRALTEPLPTNQQAYRSHHLYVIERWLKKYEILYPKGPVLGFCSGHAVYPRTCVQTLLTKERWLREGLEVKAGEAPAKVLKPSPKCNKEETADDTEYVDENHQGITALYGKWQTGPICLPRAVNGIVPKNERGRVDVWSEKCLPPGTVHLRLSRVAPVAKRLDIDFAHAMVGFEFRNGRSVPLFDGIVVCAEFKDAILEAYLEEEERRVAEQKRRNETQSLSRWYQLLSSIITRQRLNNSYGDGAVSQSSTQTPNTDDRCSKSAVSAAAAACIQKREESPRCQEMDILETSDIPPSMPTRNHEHEFILEQQAFDEEGPTRIKRCLCGFSVQFEEL